MRQERLPDVESLADPPEETMCAWCAWCANPATTTVEVEPPIKSKDKRTGVSKIKKSPIKAAACQACALRITNRYQT